MSSGNNESDTTDSATTKSNIYVNQELLNNIEENAKLISDDLVHLLGTVRNNLHVICNMSTGYMSSFTVATDNMTEEIKENVIAMHQLIKKVQQINTELSNVQQVADEIKSIKQMLNTLENEVGKLE
eukprot:TRINITY_DN32034_c2_g1_i1.p1 TRINITY_DN32034_c2_g1~~TRINITY_DN32034_c2_g1_i1.p1  ORF type:complete len:127 (+),score=11.35 TRINITY_DN32034_c2_g1_i1:143-523(+)